MGNLTPWQQKRRGTYVGTLNYMAPEMFSNCVSAIESDLWALGCIIFKMATGKVPFPGVETSLVKQLVLNRKIDWPKKPLEPTCRDLIERLLKLEPKDRLGATDSNNDIWSLMQHPFFEGIDFNGDLSKLGIKDMLLRNQKEEAQFDQNLKVHKKVEVSKLVRLSSQELAQNVLDKYSNASTKEPILTGTLIKRNRYYMH